MNMKHSVTFALTALLTPMLLFSAPRVSEKPMPPPKADAHPSITPDYGPLPDHRVNFFVDAEFLWWFANMSSTDYALKRVGALQSSDSLTVITPATEKKEFQWHWDPGFRVGIGSVTCHDGWDAYANWTYFHTHASESKRVPPFSDAFNDINVGTIVYTNSWFFTPHENPYSHIKAEIGLNFNQVDLEKGRHFWVSKNLSLRPSYGLRGYWTRIAMSVKGNNDLVAQTVEDGTTVQESTKMKQKSWSVGLLAGLEDPEQLDDRLRSFGTKFRDNFYRMQPIFDLAMGLRFESTFFNDGFRASIDLGYEYHYLYDHIQFVRETVNNSATTDLVEANGDLSMSGLVLRDRFEF